MTYDQRITGSRGSKYLNAATHSSLGGYCILVQEDTVLTTFEVNGVAALAAYGLNTITLKAGALITVPEQDSITKVVIASGAVIIYNA